VGSWRKHDELFLTGLGGATTHRFEVRRGSLELHAGCLSFARAEDHRTTRHYVPFHALDGWRLIDHSATSDE
jgi:hypothetical protein